MGKKEKKQEQDKDHLEMYGTVVETAHSVFKVQLDGSSGGDADVEDEENPSGPVIVCSIGGKLRKNKINILNGDRVKVKVSPYDLNRGIITFRL